MFRQGELAFSHFEQKQEYKMIWVLTGTDSKDIKVNLQSAVFPPTYMFESLHNLEEK